MNLFHVFREKLVSAWESQFLWVTFDVIAENLTSLCATSGQKFTVTKTKSLLVPYDKCATKRNILSQHIETVKSVSNHTNCDFDDQIHWERFHAPSHASFQWNNRGSSCISSHSDKLNPYQTNTSTSSWISSYSRVHIVITMMNIVTYNLLLVVINTTIKSYLWRSFYSMLCLFLPLYFSNTLQIVI